jgi:hypothetical protein
MSLNIFYVRLSLYESPFAHRRLYCTVGGSPPKIFVNKNFWGFEKFIEFFFNLQKPEVFGVPKIFDFSQPPTYLV